jgi:hypothetical protein
MQYIGIGKNLPRDRQGRRRPLDGTPLNESDMQSLVLRSHGLRIGPEMTRYLARQISREAVVPVIGGDARTGVPRRENIAAASLVPPITNPNPA